MYWIAKYVMKFDNVARIIYRCLSFEGSKSLCGKDDLVPDQDFTSPLSEGLEILALITDVNRTC